MKNLRTLSAAVALAAMLPLATLSPSLAEGRGPGPCTPPDGYAVGAAGPAMNGGQLMAGVGQCQRIGSWHPHYGASAYTAGAAPSNPYYGGPDY
ncbi:hypothetical protein [Bradyrhizobium genosp. P]|uniref:hypothetical protein n=1 Tax=Bradyrhizobium genosp. P TaxID=83641 RepID=UPI003CF0B70A